VSRVLGRRPGQHGTTSAQLARSLAGQPLLLILENCEHVPDGAGELALALLEHAPDARLLITSQAPLKIKGEHLLRLAPLEVPLDDAAAPQGPALELFFDRMQALQAHADLAGAELHDAVAICRHLDGIPLAIELAASRVPVVGVSGVRRRLADRFNVLASDGREATPRHRSMAACLEWSWQMLDAQEQSLLAALCRFKGRFTLRMAREAFGPSSSEWQVMTVLGALIDKSMIIQTPGSRRAFRLLETTRMFVLQRAERGSPLPADRLGSCASLGSTPDSRPPASAWSTWPAMR
jgi:predicted ATPase